MHKKYHVKSSTNVVKTLEITREIADGYMVSMQCAGQGRHTEQVEFISKTLFESGVRTGYLTPYPEKVALSATFARSPGATSKAVSRI